jgi:hypothetical protein
MQLLLTWSVVSVVIAVLAGVTASDAGAQVCAGFPTVDGQSSLGGRVGFASSTSLGVEGSYNVAGPLGFFANLNILVPEEEEADNQSIIGGGASYEVSGFIPAIPAGLSVCPVAAATFSSLEGATTLTVPVGAGFGTTLALEGGPAIMPFVIPQFVLTRISAKDVDVVSDTNFGIGVGALARLGALYGGLSLGKVFVEGSDVDVAIRAGLTFGSP